jgi:hypothetical protein
MTALSVIGDNARSGAAARLPQLTEPPRPSAIATARGSLTYSAATILGSPPVAFVTRLKRVPFIFRVGDMRRVSVNQLRKSRQCDLRRGALG